MSQNGIWAVKTKHGGLTSWCERKLSRWTELEVSKIPNQNRERFGAAPRFPSTSSHELYTILKGEVGSYLGKWNNIWPTYISLNLRPFNFRLIEEYVQPFENMCHDITRSWRITQHEGTQDFIIDGIWWFLSLPCQCQVWGGIPVSLREFHDSKIHVNFGS